MKVSLRQIRKENARRRQDARSLTRDAVPLVHSIGGDTPTVAEAAAGLSDAATRERIEARNGMLAPRCRKDGVLCERPEGHAPPCVPVQP